MMATLKPHLRMVPSPTEFEAERRMLSAMAACAAVQRILDAGRAELSWVSGVAPEYEELVLLADRVRGVWDRLQNKLHASPDLHEGGKAKFHERARH